MPAPSSTAFARPDLGQSFEQLDMRAFMQGFIGLQVMPTFGVALQTANFTKIPAEAFLQERDTARASGAGYSRAEWEFSQDNYATEEHGAEEVLDDRERKIYAYAIDFERISAMRAMDAVLRNMEKRIVAKVQDAVNAVVTAVGTPWSNPQASTPIDDVLTEIQAFKDAVGVVPNTVVLNDRVMRNLQKNEQIIDRIKYSGVDDPKKITSQNLAALWGVDRVLIPGAMRNSANQGQTVTYADLWSASYVAVMRTCSSGDLKEPGFGRVMHWTGDGSSEGGTAETYRQENIRADVMRVRLDVQEKVLYQAMRRLLSNI